MHQEVAAMSIHFRPVRARLTAGDDFLDHRRRPVDAALTIRFDQAYGDRSELRPWRGLSP